MTYKISENLAFFLLQDSAATPREVRDYFSKSCDIFLKRFKDFRTAPVWSDKEEKELRFMLEALLAAKHILVENE